jgi:hypothetical protein
VEREKKSEREVHCEIFRRVQQKKYINFRRLRLKTHCTNTFGEFLLIKPAKHCKYIKSFGMARERVREREKHQVEEQKLFRFEAKNHCLRERLKEEKHH